MPTNRCRCFLILALFIFPVCALAAEPPESTEPPAAEEATSSQADDLRRLSKDYEVWIDMKRKLVVVGGEIAIREGLLEMFACPKGTKEHESIVAVFGKARIVHAGLLAVGAKPGNPVQFHPEYVSAQGTKIEILVLWTDEKGEKHKQRAQEWVQNIRTKEPMKHEWVFAGSGFWKDETDGRSHYYGDSGDFICVSNFPTATLDLPVKSSQANSELLFGAYTDRIPPLGTKVRLVLIPQLDEKTEKEEGEKEDGEKREEEVTTG